MCVRFTIFFHFTQMFGKVHSDGAPNWADIINVLTIFFVFDCPQSLIGLDRSRDLNTGLWLVDVWECFHSLSGRNYWDNRNPNSIAAVNKIPPSPPSGPGDSRHRSLVMVTSSSNIGDHMGEGAALTNVSASSGVNTTLLLTHYVTLLSSAMGNTYQSDASIQVTWSVSANQIIVFPFWNWDMGLQTQDSGLRTQACQFNFN